MRNKDAKAQKAAVDEYFKHWDNKAAEDETEEIREVRTELQIPVSTLLSSFANNCVLATGTEIRICHLDQTVRPRPLSCRTYPYVPLLTL